MADCQSVAELALCVEKTEDESAVWAEAGGVCQVCDITATIANRSASGAPLLNSLNIILVPPYAPGTNSCFGVVPLSSSILEEIDPSLGHSLYVVPMYGNRLWVSMLVTVW